MPDYSKAKIYCIRSSQTSEVYYGSTCQSLKERFQGHKDDSKVRNLSSKQLLQYEDAYIELIEEFPCNNMAELHVRERYHIENNSCVNKYIPGRTRKEVVKIYNDTHKVEHKMYREAHKDEIKERDKAYYEANKEKIKERAKAYRDANKEKIKQYKQQYRANAKSKGGVL